MLCSKTFLKWLSWSNDGFFSCRAKTIRLAAVDAKLMGKSVTQIVKIVTNNHDLTIWTSWLCVPNLHLPFYSLAPQKHFCISARHMTNDQGTAIFQGRVQKFSSFSNLECSWQRRNKLAILSSVIRSDLMDTCTLHFPTDGKSLSYRRLLNEKICWHFLLKTWTLLCTVHIKVQIRLFCERNHGSNIFTTELM